MPSLREKIAFYLDDVETSVGLGINLTILGLILLSSVIFIAGTYSVSTTIAFYFVIVTMTTVGYGDVTPLSETGRAMTLLMILTGILFIPWQLGELIKQAVKTANLVEKECPGCNLARHDSDAKFCKQCGTKLEN